MHFGLLNYQSDCCPLLVFYSGFLVMGVDVQSQGWKTKSKSLEEVLKSTVRMEAKLIGYDETPIDVTEAQIKPIVVKGDQCSNFNMENISNGHGEAVDICSPCSIPVSRQLSSSTIGKAGETLENHDGDSDSRRAGTGIT